MDLRTVVPGTGPLNSSVDELGASVTVVVVLERISPVRFIARVSRMMLERGVREELVAPGERQGWEGISLSWQKRERALVTHRSPFLVESRGLPRSSHSRGW